MLFNNYSNIFPIFLTSNVEINNCDTRQSVDKIVCFLNLQVKVSHSLLFYTINCWIQTVKWVVQSGCKHMTGGLTGQNVHALFHMAESQLNYAWVSNNTTITIWAPSSEFVSSSIPSWQILTAHAQPFRGARDLAFCLKVPLDSLLVWVMRRLAWIFAARIGDKYQIRLTRSI